MDPTHLTLTPLLLKNGGNERNMCSLNSNLQLLRHIPELMVELNNRQNESALLSTLHSILKTCGNLQTSSALLWQTKTQLTSELLCSSFSGKDLSPGYWSRAWLMSIMAVGE